MCNFFLRSRNMQNNQFYVFASKVIPKSFLISFWNSIVGDLLEILLTTCVLTEFLVVCDCTFLSHFLAHYFKKDKTKKSGKKKFIVEHPMENHQSTTPTYEELGLFVQSTKISLSSTSSSARSSPRPSLKIRRPSNSNTKAQEKKSTSMSTKDSMENM